MVLFPSFVTAIAHFTANAFFLSWQYLEAVLKTKAFANFLAKNKVVKHPETCPFLGSHLLKI